MIRILMSTETSEQELVQRCLRRDPGAWEEFVRRYFRLVVHVVRETLKGASGHAAEADVDDLTMEVYAHIVEDDHRVLRNLREPFNLRGWLSVSARNRALGHATRGPAKPVSLDQLPADRIEARTLEKALGDDGGDVERIEELRRIIDAAPLTPREMLIVTLVFYETKSYREVGTFLGISENSVGPALSRALDKIRQEMKRKGYER